MLDREIGLESTLETEKALLKETLDGAIDFAHLDPNIPKEDRLTGLELLGESVKICSEIFGINVETQHQPGVIPNDLDKYYREKWDAIRLLKTKIIAAAEAYRLHTQSSQIETAKLVINILSQKFGTRIEYITEKEQPVIPRANLGKSLSLKESNYEK